MSRATTIHIDLTVISDNIAALRAPLSNQKLLAVLKANAYGHGAIPVAQHIEAMVDALAVAYTEEAVILRDAGIKAPILVLEGPHDASDLALIAKLDLWPVLHQEEQLQWCKAQAAHLPHVWIKLDTGMHRLGFAPDQIGPVRQQLQEMGIASVTAMSHLASAEDPDSPLTQTQLASWSRHTGLLDAPTSLHNSAATRSSLPAHSDWIRVGYALYGGQIQGLAVDPKIKAAMELRSAVLAVRQVKIGESVGYGGRWIAQRDSLIATLPVGYGDGYPWAAADGTPISINGQIAPLAGRVSMDMTTVDVTDCVGVTTGAPAVLWGDQPQIDEVANHCGTIGYELMTRLTARTPRRYHS
ncbi:MAG: alanine racemase [Luminiphilus sp.]|jgi:alanine racemase|nr:alanine racemase [Luminiphilus sp.]MDG2038298.1 alanine racemase [Luminiphilus sp.]